MIGRTISHYETIDKLGEVATGNPAGPKAQELTMLGQTISRGHIARTPGVA